VTRTINVSTELPTDADRVWAAMKQPTTFLYVTRGLFGMPALARRSEPVRAGEAGSGWLFAFHVVPAYRHTIEVVEVDDETRTLRTHEHGGVLRRWDHVLHAEPASEGRSGGTPPAGSGPRCRYTDTVTIDAGRLTSVVAAMAVGIYRYRQRRWHRLVRKHLLPT
jgi:hypothetical protein